MSGISKFDPQALNQEVLDEALQSLSDYFIPIRRLRLREAKLGTGGFGTVKLADLWSGSWTQFLETPTTVAVKELRTENYRGVELRIAFRLAREMKVWASCKHENVLEFTGYHLSKDFKKAYLISPYMKNGNIRDYLARETPSMERRLELVFDTIKGLAYLHSRTQPIVHGDLKSLNVLVNDQGRALLSDLGLAKAIEEEPTGLSTSSGFQGTFRYCSPEALRGGSPNLRSDMWAWGCLALEIITDKIPYCEYQSEPQVLLLICGPEGACRTPEPTGPLSMPPRVLRLLRACWSFEPHQRPTAPHCEREIGLILRLLILSDLSRYLNRRDLNSIKRTWEYLAVDPNAESERPRPPAFWPSSSGDLVVEDLLIRHASNLPPVLNRISFEVRPQEKVAVVGKTGSGKSTLALSLLRILEPNEGKIVLDGIDIGTVSLYDLSSRITLVSEDLLPFAGTLRSIIDPFNEFYDEECLRALELFGLASYYPLGTPPSSTDFHSSDPEDGEPLSILSQSVSPSRSNFSAGERQLLLLSRAILRRSSVIIIEEGSNSIDLATHKRIIHQEMANSIVITTTHRMKTAIEYDRILVLDEGSIAEFDTPTALLALEDGPFKEMCMQSADWEDIQATMECAQI